MKKYAKGFYMSLGMFCAIPLPFHIWDEKLTSIMVASFPLVGLVIGALWWGVALLTVSLSLPLMLTAAILTIVPFLIAGFIHLDGYMDTSDALLSYRNLEGRLRILKDPNVGAFAVIMLVILLILQFAAMHSIAENARYLALIVAIAVISRCCSAFSIFTLRHMPESNYAAMLSQNTGVSHRVFAAIVAVGAVAFSFWYAGIYGIITIAAVIVGYAVAMRKAFRGFNGISGDLLGYAMVIGEVCGFVALAILTGRYQI